MAKSQILKDIANGTVSLEVSLKRALLIASDLKNEKMVEWIKNELYGYPTGVEVPKYRIISGYFKISYVSGYQKISNQPVGATILPDSLQDFANYKCREGINFIEDASLSKEQLIIPYADLIPYLKKHSSLISVLDFYMELPTVGFKSIYSSISRELMDMLLKIDAEFGNLDDLDISPSNEQMKEINNYINIKIDSFTNIGNDNEIKDSSIAGGEITKNGKK